MAGTWVLRLPQIDRPQQPVLVHVTQKSGTIIDLDLLATDGEDAYRGKVRQRNLSKLQSKNFDGTAEDWSALLQYALGYKQESQTLQDQTKNLEVDCAISNQGSKATLSITLRSRIEDITHKLGAIELSCSENTDDVDLFGWACQLAEQRDDFTQKSVIFSKQEEVMKTTISSLETQLADLVRAKEEHEEQLLTKFAELLNEKKLKIRNQQRILKTAKVNQKKLDELQLNFGGNQTEIGSSKRQRDDARENKDEDFDGFEAMDIDKNPPADAQDDAGSGQGTPPRSDSPESATASEDEGEPGSVESVRSSKPKEKASRASPAPPPRSLPFQKKGQKNEPTKKAEQTPPVNRDEDAETESEDDEL